MGEIVESKDYNTKIKFVLSASVTCWKWHARNCNKSFVSILFKVFLNF